AKHLLVAVTRKTWVSRLHRRQEALLRGQQGALAVAIDRATFQDDTLDRVGAMRLEPRKSGDPRDGRSDLGVEVVIRILRPGVELPVHERDAAVLSYDTRWRRITQPNAVVRDNVQSIIRADSVRFQVPPCERPDLVVVTENLHAL